MDKQKIQKIFNEYYNNEVIISDTAQINSFIMDRDYFLDVFETRYEISIDLNRPIKGLKETLEKFIISSDEKIQSTSIEDSNISITIYSDIKFKNVYGIIDFYKFQKSMNVNIEKIIKKFYENDSFILPEDVTIKEYTMPKDYFMDVFGIRYETSLDLNSPIKGLKETLDSIKNISEKNIKYIKIEGGKENMIIYTDMDTEKIYGIINFSSKI